MKKFTSMLMSALVLLQVGGNIAGAKDLSDTKIETISVKVPETNSKKFVVIQKENKGTSFGTKIVSIAGASILAGLGAFGVYKFVTRNKKTDDKDTKKKKKDEEETEKETPKDQTLKSKGTDLGGLSDEELEQLNSENNQQLSKYEGVNAHSAPPPMIKKLQDDKQQIQNEIDKRQRSKSQSQSQSSENASNRTLGIVKYEQSPDPERDIKNTQTPESSRATETTENNRTLSLVDGTSKIQEPQLQPPQLKPKNEAKPKPMTNPGIIKLETNVGKYIKSFTIYGDSSTLSVIGLPSNVKIQYVPREQMPSHLKHDNFIQSYGGNHLPCLRHIIVTYPDYLECGGLNVVADITYDKLTDKSSLYSAELRYVLDYIFNQWYFSNENGQLLKIWVSDMYSSPQVHYRGEWEQLYNWTNLKLLPEIDSWEDVVISLVPTKPEIISKGNDPRVNALIQKFEDSQSKPIIQIKDKAPKDAPIALLTCGDLREALKIFGLEPTSAFNNPDYSPLPKKVEVQLCYHRKDKQGNPNDVEFIIDPNCGPDHKLSVTAKNSTTLQEFSINFRLNPNGTGRLPVTFRLYNSLADYPDFARLGVQTKEGGTLLLDLNSREYILDKFKNYKREEQSKIFSEMNKVIVNNFCFVHNDQSYSFNTPMSDVAALVLHTGDRVFYIDPEKITGTWGDWFKSHKILINGRVLLNENDIPYLKGFTERYKLDPDTNLKQWCDKNVNDIYGFLLKDKAPGDIKPQTKENPKTEN